MRINIYPSGEKCTYQRSLMAAAFAVLAVTFMSLMGAPSTRAQAQTPQSPCPQSPAPTSTVTNEELVSDPATMGMMGGGTYLGYIGFANAYSILVGTPVEILMTRIIGKNVPPVEVNELDQNQSNVANGPCIPSSRISGGAIK
jgi:hypothetical protein